MSDFNKIDEIIKTKIKKKEKRKNIYILLIVIGLIVFNKFIGLGIAKGDSMHPIVKNGDLMIYFKFPRNIKVNDIVISDLGETVVKRIKEIKDEKIYLIGDNSEYSYDSRDYGTVSKDKIIGKVICICNLRKDK